MVPFTILVLIAFVFISCVEAMDGNVSASTRGEGWFPFLIQLAILLWTAFRAVQGQGDAPGAGGEIVGNYQLGCDPPGHMYA